MLPLMLGKKPLYPVIPPKCITILYHNSPLFIDIFHIMMILSWCFGMFYTVYNFPVLKQENQESVGKIAHRVGLSAQLQMTWGNQGFIFIRNHEGTQKYFLRGATRP